MFRWTAFGLELGTQLSGEPAPEVSKRKGVALSRRRGAGARAGAGAGALPVSPPSCLEWVLPACRLPLGPECSSQPVSPTATPVPSHRMFVPLGFE